jgi:hypothetical protein
MIPTEIQVVQFRPKLAFAHSRIGSMISTVGLRRKCDLPLAEAYWADYRRRKKER